VYVKKEQTDMPVVVNCEGFLLSLKFLEKVIVILTVVQGNAGTMEIMALLVMKRTT